MRFAQRLITIADWSLTLAGILLIILGGYGMLYVSHVSPIDTKWLIYGQLLFAASGAVWLAILIPAQVRLARWAIKLMEPDDGTTAYSADSKLWLF